MIIFIARFIFTLLPLQPRHSKSSSLSASAVGGAPAPKKSQGQQQRRRGSLARLVIILVVIHDIFHLSYNWLPSRLFFDLPHSPEVSVLRAFLTYSAQMLSLLASMIVIVFWYDALRLKTHEMTRAKRIVIGLAIAITLMTIVGLVLSLTSLRAFAGFALDAIVVFGIVVMCVLLHRVRKEDIPQLAGKTDNHRRHRWIVRFALWLVITWVVYQTIYYVSLVLGFLQAAPGLQIPIEMGKRLSRISIVFALTALVDYRFGTVRRLLSGRCTCRGVSETSSSGRSSTNANTNNNSSNHDNQIAGTEQEEEMTDMT
jgi:hypothetical protein